MFRFFFLNLDCVFFLITEIKNNKIENEKKFTNVKLYGGKLSIVIAPKKKGAKKRTKNLLLNKWEKLKIFITNFTYNFFFNFIHFKIFFIFNMIISY